MYFRPAGNQGLPGVFVVFSIILTPLEFRVRTFFHLRPPPCPFISGPVFVQFYEVKSGREPAGGGGGGRVGTFCCAAGIFYCVEGLTCCLSIRNLRFGHNADWPRFQPICRIGCRHRHFSKTINIRTCPVIIRLAWTYRPNVHKSAGTHFSSGLSAAGVCPRILDRWWQWRQVPISVHPSSA